MLDSSTRVLVAGVGNVFLGDDGFGVEVARRLDARRLPDGVRAADFGLRSLHLAYEMLDHPEALTVIVDAMSRGAAPGTLFLVEPEGVTAPATPGDAHSVTPDGVLAMVHALGGASPRVVILGCEPASCDERMGLSPAVEAAIDGAVDMILSLVATLDQEKARPCA
ncbi:MAG: hydrogenase maturation protease [Vicinamibacterales bacterium]